MNSQIRKAGEFGLSKCPSCFYNFVQPLCDMTCSPNQTSFMKVHAEEGDPKRVKSVNISISEEFLNGTFNSCIEVNYPNLYES